MLYYAAKVGLSAVIIVVVAELAKRHSGFAALVASLPLVSILAFVWLHLDGVASARIAQLSSEILWLTIPSFALFIALPPLLKHGFSFWLSLGLSMAITVVCYFALLPLLRRLGVSL
jgi:ABC-type proline/glycine betaine transport system permease subunit